MQRTEKEQFWFFVQIVNAVLSWHEHYWDIFFGKKLATNVSVFLSGRSGCVSAKGSNRKVYWFREISTVAIVSGFSNTLYESLNGTKIINSFPVHFHRLLVSVIDFNVRNVTYVMIPSRFNRISFVYISKWVRLGEVGLGWVRLGWALLAFRRVCFFFHNAWFLMQGDWLTFLRRLLASSFPPGVAAAAAAAAARGQRWLTSVAFKSPHSWRNPSRRVQTGPGNSTGLIRLFCCRWFGYRIPNRWYSSICHQAP